MTRTSACYLLCRYKSWSTDAKRIRTVQSFSTAVWLDRIDAIKGGSVNGGRLSLTKHLDAALVQVCSCAVACRVCLALPA